MSIRHVRQAAFAPDAELSQEEVGQRFLRTAMFLMPRPCFETQRQLRQCCEVDGGPWPSHRWCFDALFTREACCRKERYWDLLFGSASVDLPERNASLQAGPDTAPGCEALHNAGSGLAWLRSLLALPEPELAPCVAGALAGRLQGLDAEAALGTIIASLQARCPGRRALVALRRNVMLWQRRSRFARPVYAQLLHTLERCRRALPRVSVLHLHMPKTAGSSICEWARQNGLHRAAHLDQGCHLRGDGPYWIGQAAVAASCRQRLIESEATNASWMSVERWVDLPLCEQFSYVVALRDPVARTLHHFEHLLRYFLDSEMISNALDVKGFRRHLFRKLWRISAVRLEWDRHTAIRAAWLGPSEPSPDWLGLWSGMASNYQVRSLAGADTAFEDLNPGHLRMAKELLEQFDVVLTVGAGLIGFSQERLLRFLLRVPTRARQRDGRGPGPRVPFVSHRARLEPFPGDTYAWADGEREEMRRRNAADIALVAHARLLQRLDQEYFEIVAPAEAARFSPDGQARALQKSILRSR